MLWCLRHAAAWQQPLAGVEGWTVPTLHGRYCIGVPLLVSWQRELSVPHTPAVNAVVVFCACMQCQDKTLAMLLKCSCLTPV
jgi:hypothetical protein